MPALAGFVALASLAYAFIVSAGTFSTWPTYSNYYDLLAESFRAGRLDLLISPSPRLLAAEDPFDPALAPLWVWDASLHEGRYYLYWGPLPAILEAAFKAAFGITRSLGDQYLLFLFSVLELAIGVAIVDRLARRVFPEVSRYFVVLALLVFAFGNPLPHSLASPAIYQAAIAAGQAFLLGGVLLAFDAVADGPGAPGFRRRLLLAGGSWALALACRISLAPAVLLLVGVTAALAVGPRLRLALRLGLPVAGAILLLLLYNQARFGSWLEFGVSNQLTTMPFHVSAAYVPRNLFSYALRPFDLACEFPYVLQRTPATTSWLSEAPGYLTHEPLVGMLLASPWSWLAPIGILVVPWSSIRDGSSRTLVWCSLTFAILASVTGFPELVSFIATMRYLGDVAPGIALSGILGAWWWHARTRPGTWPRRLVLATCTLLAAATIACGLLLGFQGYEGHFRKHNPELHDRIVAALSWCGP